MQSSGFLDYVRSLFFLGDRRARETQTRVKTSPSEKGETRARVSLALLTLREMRTTRSLQDFRIFK